MNSDGGFRWLGLGNYRCGGEIEGNAENVGILDIEESLAVQLIGLAAQAENEDLLTK